MTSTAVQYIDSLRFASLANIIIWGGGGGGNNHIKGKIT